MSSNKLLEMVKEEWGKEQFAVTVPCRLRDIHLSMTDSGGHYSRDDNVGTIEVPAEVALKFETMVVFYKEDDGYSSTIVCRGDTPYKGCCKKWTAVHGSGYKLLNKDANTPEEAMEVVRSHIEMLEQTTAWYMQRYWQGSECHEWLIDHAKRILSGQGSIERWEWAAAPRHGGEARPQPQEG